MPAALPWYARARTWVTRETTGGIILLIAALIALIWANLPARDVYADIVAWRVGPEFLNLNLSLGTWAADGLLAVFFFVVGVELKHELRVGSLSNLREAAVPMLAAVGGMVVPALAYVSVVLLSGTDGVLTGWPIPTATDIAFALGVLAVFGRGLPVALRVFLLTLAVVDDLLAIIVIAVFYTETISFLSLIAAVVCVLVFGFIATRNWARWWMLLPVAAIAWWLMHESGVHATVAGVLLGFTVPTVAIGTTSQARTLVYEHAVRPFSTAVALPAFAFLSAGVTIVGNDLAAILGSPIALGILTGLTAGKVIGVLATTLLVTHVTGFRLPPGLGIRDLLGVGFLTGIGFTVSLLMAELSFSDPAQLASAKAAVLLASLIAATLGAACLRWTASRPRKSDMNEDGIPDGPLPTITAEHTTSGEPHA